MYAGLCACMYVYVGMHVGMDACMYVGMYACMFVCMCVCMYVCPLKTQEPLHAQHNERYHSNQNLSGSVLS